MHPEISVLPSRIFYNGRLLNGPDMAAKTQKPWHTSQKFGPYRFYNVAKGVEEKGRFHSLVNRTEAQVAVALFNRLRQEFPSYDFDFRIGIVTMYRAQVSELRRAFEQRFGSNITGVIDFNTVDGFQGQEKDIIILSCVRAGVGLTRVGFLAGELSSGVGDAGTHQSLRCAAYERRIDTSEVVGVRSWQRSDPRTQRRDVEDDRPRR